MPALCPSARRSTRLAAKSQAIFKASTMIPSTDFGANHQAPFCFPPPQNSGSYPQQYVLSPRNPYLLAINHRSVQRNVLKNRMRSRSLAFIGNGIPISPQVYCHGFQIIRRIARSFSTRVKEVPQSLKRAKRIRLRLRSRVWFSRKMVYIQRHIPKIWKDFLRQ